MLFNQIGGSFAYIPCTMEQIKACYEDETKDPKHINNKNKTVNVEFPTCGISMKI